MTQDEVGLIESVILIVRGRRVILSGDLARIYGVETRALNQAVKRNTGKFPEDFMFRLTSEEAAAIHSRSQSVILKQRQNIKYLPYAFTEHGAIDFILINSLYFKRHRLGPGHEERSLFLRLWVIPSAAISLPYCDPAL